MDVFDLQGKASIDISPYVSGIKEATQMNDALVQNIDRMSKKVDSLEYYMRRVSNTADNMADALKNQSKETEKEGEASEDAADETKKLGNEIKTTGDNSEKATSKIKDLAEGIGNGLATAAKVGATAVGAAAAGVGALVKQSVANYSEYEQLVGGIDKLFGEASEKVQENAEKAYATAGMSANEYMQQVTGFAASLIQATGRGAQQDIDELQEALDAEYAMTKQTLADEYDDVKEYWNDRIKASKAAKDGEADALQKQRDEELKALKRANEEKLNELKAYNKQVVSEAEQANNTSVTTIESLTKAADLADVAMKAISDNVNTFGTDMGSVQNAFQGFAKQNYTMLDNLRLGYGGTKAEMERLIDDANIYAESIGEASDLSINSFADIVQAIDLIQRKQGISGTTAKEAAKTITGSITAVKAAWQNLTVEMAKADGDVGAAFETLGANVGAVVENMLPKVENALGGVGELITAAAPQITAGLKRLLPKVLPELLRTAGSIVSTVGQAVITALPEMLDVGKDLLASIAEIDFSGNGIIGNLLDTIIGNAGDYFEYGEKILSNIGNAIINSDHSKLGAMFSTVITNGLNSITNLLADLDTQKIGQNIADFVKAIDWKAIASSIVDLLGAAIGSLGEIAKGFFTNMNGETFMNAIAVLAAPKLLKGMLTAFKGNECAADWKGIKDYMTTEIGGSGKDAGISWSTAFMAGIKAFGLGWAIGTYIRQSIGEEKVDTFFEETSGAVQLQQVIKAAQDKADEENTVTYVNENGKTVNARKYDPETGEKTRAYIEYELAQQREMNAKVKAAKDRYLGIDNTKDYTNTQNVSYGMPQSILDMINNRYAIGGYVNEPQVAVVGESEPEYIIPESKMDDVYSRNSGNVYVEKVEFNITGAFDMGSPEDRERLIEEMSSRMQTLSIAQQRALGGAGWQ